MRPRTLRRARFLPRPSPTRNSQLATRCSQLVLPFDPAAADLLRAFAEAIEPRLAPGEDLDPIVDWASKLVGATARIAGLLHLASLPLPAELPLPLGEGRGEGYVGGEVVESAIAIAHYLVEHAKAAYAAMGLDPAAAYVPELLAWIRRTDRRSFTRRDALRASGRRLRSAADLNDTLDQLEQHGYIRLRPHQRRPGQGRPPGPVYEVHPSLTSHQSAPPLPRTGDDVGGADICAAQRVGG